MCPSLVVQHPQHATGLPCRDKGTLGYVPQDVVVSQVRHLRHVLGQLVGQLVQGLYDISALADVEPYQILVQRPQELLRVPALPWNAAIAAGASLVGEDHAPEGAREQVVLVELARGDRRAADGDVRAQYRIARHAIRRGTQSTSALAVVDISDHVRHLLVSAAHAVGHLHLGQVEVLSAATQILARHAVEDEGRIGNVRGRKPEGNVRPHGLLLVGRLALDLLLPLNELLQLRLVVSTEVTANGFHQIAELPLVAARIGHQICHHAAQFFPTEVRIQKFRTAYMCAQYREKHRNERCVHVFRHLREQDFYTFCPLAKVWHLRGILA